MQAAEAYHSQGETLMEEANSFDEDYDYEYGCDEDYESESSCGDLSAQQQWEESMKQLGALATLVIIPLVGKLLGRRCSMMIWKRIAHGWYSQGVL